MCLRLRDLQQSVSAFAIAFDAHALTPAQAGEVVGLAAQIEACAASIKTLAAARDAESSDWQLEGFRSAADKLAAQTKTSSSKAISTLETGRRLANQPEVAHAALSGQLSPDQAEAVADGAAANPDKARDLIDKAKTSSMSELNDEVAKVKADAAPDPDQRRQRMHAQRSLRKRTDRDGLLQAHLTGPPEDGARLWRMLDPLRRRLNLLRRQAGIPNERLDALDYDALMLMADIAIGKDGELSFADLRDLGLFPQLAPTVAVDHRTAPPTEPALFPADCHPPEPAADGPPPKRRGGRKLAGSAVRIMIRVDLDTLLRGVPLEGELCEMSGYGPIPVSVIEDVLATENPFIIGILTKAKALVGVYHHGRHPNAYQRSALDFAYPTCAAQGCAGKAGLQYDHRIDWSNTGYTVYDLLDRLCPHHHRLKTQRNWNLIDGSGKRPFVPPHDPRHPGHARDGPTAPAATA